MKKIARSLRQHRELSVEVPDSSEEIVGGFRFGKLAR
jgi:hypothetical protein